MVLRDVLEEPGHWELTTLIHYKSNQLVFLVLTSKGSDV